MSLTFLIWGGKTGWVGGLLTEELTKMGHKVVAAESRLENLPAIEEELDRVNPDRIFNAAGKTGRPNIDWCETNRPETLKANVVGTLNLQLAAAARNIHATHFVTGCVYHFTESGEYSIEGGKGFTEEDPPNFDKSYYSMSKMLLEKLLVETFGDAPMLLLRVRLPLGNDMNHRSLITKLLKYEYLVNIPNSITVLDNMLPIAIAASIDQQRGVFNYTNEGTISHKELMELYKEIVDPNVTWKHFSLEEQNKILSAARSNNKLDVSKLKALYPQLLPVHEAVRQAFIKVKANNEKEKQ